MSILLLRQEPVIEPNYQESDYLSTRETDNRSCFVGLKECGTFEGIVSQSYNGSTINRACGQAREDGDSWREKARTAWCGMLGVDQSECSFGRESKAVKWRYLPSSTPIGIVI
ncbi:hypothetical protein VFPPC_18472 [Pochonia chlamydosporia 170]|uniref:Uncharacterized protein n=1 Tax=Pochonia chlamydosporia 170 TaxID=1380566 RepID=A0A219APB3_METCM|nr:hypothetical protein VFPPC_18472 [Pochonia chlamydosporia 170]OWT42392.1 hypothetical protein VFPPC_18472 [Pochonia chlamydosporia 170]